MAAGLAFWQTLLAGGAGGVFTLVGTLGTQALKGRQERNAAKDARAAEREQSRADRREQHELDSLSDLHAALGRLMRGVTRFHLEDVQVARERQSLVGAFQLPHMDEVAEQIRLANVEVSTLTRLVLDDALRAQVDDAHAAVSEMLEPPRPEPEANAVLRRAGAAVRSAQDAIAARIRSIYLDTGKYQTGITSPELEGS